jgi:hypothetical protein
MIQRKLRPGQVEASVFDFLMINANQHPAFWMAKPSAVFDGMSGFDFVEALIKAGQTEDQAWKEVYSIAFRIYGGSISGVVK